jgi:hypothetical protein
MGQRHAIELSAELDHRVDVRIRELEALIHGLRPIDEQRDGAVVLRGLGRRSGLRDRQPAESEDSLVLHLQGDLAGDEQAHARGSGGHGIGQPCDVFDQVLGVVEHEKHVERLQACDERGKGILDACDR